LERLNAFEVVEMGVSRHRFLPAAGRGRRGPLLGLLAVAISTALAGSAAGARPALATGDAGRALNFELVGHDSLFGRGVNAAAAFFDHYVYVGSRSDGTHLHSGVAIVDVADPSHPTTVGEIALPATLTAGYTSRELRVWPQQKVLMVLYFGCSALIHACVSASDTGLQPLRQVDFFDLTSSNAAAPVMVSSYTPSTTPHEMFLWVDPVHAGRALLYWTSPNNSAKQLVVTDLSAWNTTKTFPEVATYSAVPGFSADQLSQFDVRLHSLSLSPDGTRAYLAYLGGGVLIIDTSDLAAGLATPKIRMVTPVSGRAYWDYEGAHSTVPIPGTSYLLTTEELYGKGGPLQAAFGPAFAGCPWGWVRIVDASNPASLKVVSEYRLAENQASYCAGISALQDNFSSYTSHNPTVLPNLALVTWHSAGLQAIDLSDPLHPAQAGYFLSTPDPILPNHTVDPALEAGSNGVIAWSYPIISNGLIYFIDIRNGLYIVRYTGRFADEVEHVGFLEGNSNLGDAARLASGATTSEASSGTLAAESAGGGGHSLASLPNTGLAPAGAAGITALAVVGLTAAVRRRRRRATAGRR
jgi:hypothetical protein